LAATLVAALTILALATGVAVAQGSSADLRVTLSAPAVVPPNETMTYTIVAENLGPDTSTAPTMSFDVPAATTFIGDTPPSGWTCTQPVSPATIYSCTRASFAAGGLNTFRIMVQVPLLTPPGTVIPATAFLDSAAPGEVDPDNGNDQSSDSTTVTDTGVSADLQVVVTGPAGPLPVGSPITYDLDVSNLGPDVANSVRLRDDLPLGVTFGSASGPGWSCSTTTISLGRTRVNCTLASLAVGASSPITIIAQLTSGDPGDFVTNQAAASSNELDPTAESDVSTSFQISGRTTADLSIAKSGPATALINGNVRYTIVVRNNGPDASVNPRFTDTLPLGSESERDMTFVSATIPGGLTCTLPAVGSAGTVSCDIASLAAGQSVPITIEGSIPLDPAINPGFDPPQAGEFYTNTATITSTQVGENDPTPENDDASAVTQVSATAEPDLSLLMTNSSSGSTTRGSFVNFGLRVTNVGSGTTSGTVTVSYTLPPGLIVGGVTPLSWSCTSTTTEVECTQSAPLAPGADYDLIVISAGVDPSAADSVDVNASVSGGGDTNGVNNLASNTLSVSWAPTDVSVDKTAPAAAAAGGALGYSVVVTNLGPAVAGNLTMQDALPAGVTFAALTTPPGWSCTTPAVGANGTISCAAADLGVGVSSTFAIDTTAPPATGNITNTAAVTSVDDPNRGNDSDDADTTIDPPSADVSLTKTAPASAAPGTEIDYTIAVANAGPDTAATLQVTDALPAGTTFVSLTAAGWTCTTPAVGTAGTITCDMATMAAAGSSTLTLRVAIDAAATGSIANTAAVSTATGDPNGGNNSDSASTAVSGADVSVTKTAPPDAQPNDVVSYAITVANAGPAAAATVQLTDALPAGVTFQSLNSPAGWTCTTPALGGTGTVNCSIATLGSGANGAFSVNVRIDDATTGVVSNTATVAASSSDPDTTNNSATATTAVNAADVSVATSGPSSATRGSTIHYIVTVSNAGPNDAVTVKLSDTMLKGARLASLDVPTGWTCTTSAPDAIGKFTCTIPTLAVGAGSAFKATVTVDEDAPGAFLLNTAILTSESSDPNPANDFDHFTTNLNLIDTTITLASTPDPSFSGQKVRLTATIAESDAGTPTGTVTFSDTGGMLHVDVPLTGNTATLETAVLTATTDVTAKYNGDAAFGSSTSAPLTQTVVVGGSLALVIAPQTTAFYALGQSFNVVYFVTNDGPVTVSGIAVTDPIVPAILCPLATLSAGASMACVGAYTITAADMATGEIVFTATASGNGQDFDTATATIESVAGTIIDTFNELGQDFVATRNSLVSSGVNPPGINDRTGSNNVGLTESKGDPTLNFSASLLSPAGEAAASLADGSVETPFNVWIDGTFTLHTRDNGGGSFGLVGTGADYLVTENILVGAALYTDMMTDVATNGTVTGRGVIVGPYVSVKVTPGITFDASAFYGQSWNTATSPMFGTTFTGDFTTQRFFARARLNGEWSLDELTIRPDATLFLANESVAGYTVTDAFGNAIPIAGFTTQSLSLSAGTTIEHSFDLDNGVEFVPEVGFRLGVSGSGTTMALGDPFGTALIGFRLAGENWTVRSTVETSLWASSLKAATWRGSVSGQF
jgi:uncharacterized repeat protein (TIGR01451 family)